MRDSDTLDEDGRDTNMMARDIVREDRGTFSEVTVEQSHEKTYSLPVMPVNLPGPALPLFKMVNFKS